MGDGVDFAAEVEALDDCVVVRVSGELDMASTPDFETTLLSVTPDVPVVIDLDGCTFLDSTGIGAIAAAVRRSPRVSIVATSPAIVRVLEITALDTMVTVHPTLEDAR